MKTLIAVNAIESYEKLFSMALKEKYIDSIIKTTPENFNSDVDTIFSNGDTPIFMKGLIETGDFMKLILHNKNNLYTKGNLLSHCGIFNNKFIITDAAMNMYPDADTKLKITQNAIWLHKKLNPDSIKKPKISAITPAGKANPKIQSSVDAEFLKNELSDTADVVLDQLDTAISEAAAKSKGYKNWKPADIILSHDLDSGNILYKSLTLFTEYSAAGLIIGANYPICVNSRADTLASKLSSIKCAAQTSR